jgi:hypothetical protein
MFGSVAYSREGGSTGSARSYGPQSSSGRRSRRRRKRSAVSQGEPTCIAHAPRSACDQRVLSLCKVCWKASVCKACAKRVQSVCKACAKRVQSVCKACDLRKAQRRALHCKTCTHARHTIQVAAPPPPPHTPWAPAVAHEVNNSLYVCLCD